MHKHSILFDIFKGILQAFNSQNIPIKRFIVHPSMYVHTTFCFKYFTLLCFPTRQHILLIVYFIYIANSYLTSFSNKIHESMFWITSQKLTIYSIILFISNINFMFSEKPILVSPYTVRQFGLFVGTYTLHIRRHEN